MTFKYKPLVVAAIATGSLAVLVLVVAVVTAAIRRTCLRDSQLHPSSRWNSGSLLKNATPPAHAPPFASAPSIPQASAANSTSALMSSALPPAFGPAIASASTAASHTALETPTSVLGNMHYAQRDRERDWKRGRAGAGVNRGRAADAKEIFMVTYEQGLQARGLDNPPPHHILVSEAPQSGQLRSSPGRKGPPRVVGLARNGSETSGRIDGLQSTWLPSYYHSDLPE